MGRRLKSTKGGRFINPADQERKAARKRELKKNKKQRGMVRTAVLKSKDEDDIIIQMQKLDQMEFDTNIPCPLPERVVGEKRFKLRETYLRILGMYKKEEEPDKHNELKKKLQNYDMLRAEMEQNFAAFKFAKDTNPAEIPLPDGLAGPEAAMTPQVPESSGPGSSGAQIGPSFPSHMILPEYRGGEPSHGILRKQKRRSDYPPGVPAGEPPELSESEDEEDSEGSENEDGVGKEQGAEKSTRVRFAGVGEGEEEKDTRTKYKKMAKKIAAGETITEEAGELPTNLPPGPPPMGASAGPPMLRHPVPGGNPLFPQGARLMRPPPPPPGMPPRLMMSGRMPIPLPPSGMAPLGMRMMGMAGRGPPPGIGPQAMGAPAPSSAAVIEAEPTVTKRTGPIIEGKPQLRNMQKEVTKLIPTALRVRRDGDKKKPRPNYSGGLMMSSGGQNVSSQQGGQTKDNAYDEFMSEISGLL